MNKDFEKALTAISNGALRKSRIFIREGPRTYIPNIGVVFRMSNKKLKDNTVEVCNLPDFAEILGCFTQDKKHTHLGRLFDRITSCGRPADEFMAFARDVTVDCPDCVAEITYRSKNPAVAKQDFGVVTHK